MSCSRRSPREVFLRLPRPRRYQQKINAEYAEMKTCAESAEDALLPHRTGPPRRALPLQLLVSQALHRVQTRRTRRGIQASTQADHQRKADSPKHEPPRHGPDVLGGQLLPLQINICSEVDGPPDRPTEQHAEEAAEHAHSARFHEEEPFDIGIARAKRLHDADLAPA